LDHGHEFVYAILYRALPPTYLNDAMINAACERIMALYPRTRYIGGTTASFRTKTQGINRNTLTRIKDFVAGGDVDTVFIPVNFGNAHWCGIIVGVPEKIIFTYDPLNHTDFRTSLTRLGDSLVRNGLSDFTVEETLVPIQQDLYSCGGFVAWFFYRSIDANAPKDMSTSALTNRRFELFYFVLNGSPPPQSPPLDIPVSQPVGQSGDSNRATTNSLALPHLALEFTRVSNRFKRSHMTDDREQKGGDEEQKYGDEEQKGGDF
jgi:hypothetical protein